MQECNWTRVVKLNSLILECVGGRNQTINQTIILRVFILKIVNRCPVRTSIKTNFPQTSANRRSITISRIIHNRNEAQTRIRRLSSFGQSGGQSVFVTDIGYNIGYDYDYDNSNGYDINTNNRNSSLEWRSITRNNSNNNLQFNCHNFYFKILNNTM